MFYLLSTSAIGSSRFGFLDFVGLTDDGVLHNSSNLKSTS